MSRMNMLLSLLLRILSEKKPVGQGLSVARHAHGAFTRLSELGIMSSIIRMIGKIYTIFLAEKPVGTGFKIVWHVLLVSCAIVLNGWLFELAGHSLFAGIIIVVSLADLGFAIWRPGVLFSTELVDDYESFLPHWAEHCYRDLTRFVNLLCAHIASLVCVHVSLPGAPPRPSVPCEDATRDSVQLRHLILATTHVLRAPPSFA